MSLPGYRPVLSSHEHRYREVGRHPVRAGTAEVHGERHHQVRRRARRHRQRRHSAGRPGRRSHHSRGCRRHPR
ncbi:hypothetical protein RER_30480 [Rhodococcus erythropolis PR4]|uniref:Uncharacterized protein n=1 Tax=Rhodococcus erythropolis (strain PR4 / NBRC 100887) TaxID=234621 RepID=C0ZZH1_RHOE4|nr:hypothetical protein RER_30480 [Rhodococcus erythropolis PR4]